MPNANWTLTSVTVETAGTTWVTDATGYAGAINAYSVQVAIKSGETVSRCTTITIFYTKSAKASKQTASSSIVPSMVLSSPGLSTGTAVGIGVGCTSGTVAIACAVAFLFRRRRKSRHDSQKAEQSPLQGQPKMEQPRVEASASPTTARISTNRINQQPHYEMDSMQRGGTELPVDPVRAETE